jgi:hypothetical protein
MITGQSAPITATLAGVRMSAVGHQRRFERVPAISALPPTTDVLLSRANDA